MRRLPLPSAIPSSDGLPDQEQPGETHHSSAENAQGLDLGAEHRHAVDSEPALGGRGGLGAEAEGDIVNCPSRLDKTGKEGLSGITCPVACQSRVPRARRA